MNTKNSINESLEIIRRALEDEKNDSNKDLSSNNMGCYVLLENLIALTLGIGPNTYYTRFVRKFYRKEAKSNKQLYF